MVNKTSLWRCNVLLRLTLYFLCDSELSYLIVNYNISHHHMIGTRWAVPAPAQVHVQLLEQAPTGSPCHPDISLRQTQVVRAQVQPEVDAVTVLSHFVLPCQLCQPYLSLVARSRRSDPSRRDDCAGRLLAAEFAQCLVVLPECISAIQQDDGSTGDAPIPCYRCALLTGAGT